MKALYFDKSLKKVYDIPRPKPEKHEALIRVLKAGICNTDLEIINGYNKFTGIPGHEFVGIVEGVYEPNTHLKGKRVVGEINIGCGHCNWCMNSIPQHCTNRKAIGIKNRNGCFAEYLTIPIKNLHVVPENVSNENAVFIEPLAASIEFLSRIKIAPSTEILVMGDGKLGLITAYALKSIGFEVQLLGKYLHKMIIARNIGIDALVYDEILHKSFPIIIDATGKPDGIEKAIQLIQPRGTIITKSTYTSGESINLTKVAVNEIQILGSRCGDFKPALQLLQQGLDLTRLISGVFEFEDSLDAYKAAIKGGALKYLIHFSS